MNPFFSFVIKETKHIVRDKRTMLILFGMPIVMMLIFGFAITNEVKHVRSVVVMSHADLATQQVVNRLSASEYFNLTHVVPTPAAAQSLIRNHQADMAVVFAPHFAERQAGFQFIVDGADPNMAQQWTAFAAAVIRNSAVGNVNVQQLYNPQMRSTYHFVPAIMGMLLMLVCAMMTSISIVREKEKGTMEVLLVSPTPPLLIIVAKVIPYLVLAFLILLAILLMSVFVLDVPILGSLGWICTLSAVYILIALALGLLISCVAHTQLEALLISAMVLLMPVLMLSGMIFPLESMPRVLQWISMTIPTRYYISAMRKLMIMGVGFEQIVHELLVLIGMFIALLSLSLAKFNKRLA